MKKLLTMLTSLTLMGLAGVAPAQAAIVAGWNSFNAATASYPKAADTVGANITSTGLDTAGIDRRVQSFVLGSTVSTSPGRWNGNSTVNTGQYVEFAVQPSAGFQVDFTDLQLNARQDETQLDLVLRSSVDGFTNNLGTQVSLTNSFNTYSFDLSSLAPQTGPVQFRLYGLNASGLNVLFIANNSANVAGGGFVALNGDITPTPTVSTPEPSGIVSLIAVGALGAASLRRRG
ncbi:MAG: PEP-CTERM sorting domain-containing protein [Microcystis aeruginosa Ma_MB_S_20031200_S102]|uniref:PEP-CTERM sorting domain-containing protein n=1 Tax=Microcystis aeruginosa Ma_MB_S_20031200_S102 TaxID=2486254 RepID=A0A552F2L8_MICAE|nr:MAG: PEP-CTERM sorting domain-containing protein [Microcystis aeruginosa Ma_MB_S_20031200_S102D]TRU40959.1 MAG: PEP-CTERM sorting domain-containing protein [Microcystis aeruginosa Ma_MB_S_20031200_S102]